MSSNDDKVCQYTFLSPDIHILYFVRGVVEVRHMSGAVVDVSWYKIFQARLSVFRGTMHICN